MIQEAEVQGIPRRSVDEPVRAMGMDGVSKSQVSRLCAEIDARWRDFRARPIEGDWPYFWLDATYVKARGAGRVVPVAVSIAVGMNADGRHAALGMAVGSSETEPVWLVAAVRRPSAPRHAAACAAGSSSSPMPMGPGGSR